MPMLKHSASYRIAVAFLAVMALVLAGCRTDLPRPAVVYELTDSGVVTSVEEIQGGGLRVALARGESIDLLLGAVDLYGEIPVAGELILVGSNGSSLGYATTRERDECYVLNEPAVEDGTHILFDFGLRLPKSPRFDPGPIDDGRFPSFREGFCINTAGEVIRYGS
jgi:hypothetical protein